MPVRSLLSVFAAFLALAGSASPIRDIQGDSSLPAFVADGAQLKVVSVTNPFGYGAAADGRYSHEPYVSGWKNIAEVMPPALMAELKSAGFNAVRLVVDPAPLLFLGEGELSRLLQQVTDGAGYIVGAGLKCIVDIHPSPDPLVRGFSSADLLDGPGAKFVELTRIEARLAAELERRFPASAVALEVFNEPPSIGGLLSASRWIRHLDFLYTSIRRAAPRLTLVLSGDDYGGLDALMTLDPARYDANTIYSFHDYHPMVFTHQSVEAAAVGFGIRYVRRLAFPPDPAQKKSVTDEALAAIAADRTLSASQRVDLGQKLTGVLSAYFDVPQDEQWIAERFRSLRRWTTRHGVSPRRVFLGEFGAWGDINSRPGADDHSRARYLAAVRRLADSHGIGWSVWELANPFTAWRIVVEEGNGRRLDPAVKAALFDAN